MSRNTIRLILVVGTFSIIGILLIQAYWVIKNYELKEKEFDLTVRLILKNVAENILKYNHNTSPLVDPVQEISPDFFTVKVNDKIDSNLLGGLLRNEFLKEGIKTDIFYSIYDCMGKKIDGSGMVCFDSTSECTATMTGHLPDWNYDNFYFSVYFPEREKVLLSEMKLWLFSTIVLIVVIIFFAYVLFVVFQQKRLSEIQKDFINNMTHEFRTPISTILISCEVLKDSKITDNPQRLNSYAAIIESQAHRLNQHIERVLQMAKTDKGYIQLKHEQINIHDLLLEAISKINSSGNNDRLTIENNFLAENPIFVGDRLHLLNIVYNLLDNSIKYCKKDPKVIITTKENNSDIKISLADNGIGIASEYQKKVFDKFFRVPSGNVHNVKGFGLGLNYVKNIVKAHHGKIELKSQIEQGSVFTVTLPRNK